MLENRDVMLNGICNKSFIVSFLCLNVYADCCYDKEMGIEMNRIQTLTSKELTGQWGKTKESVLQEEMDKEA